VRERTGDKRGEENKRANRARLSANLSAWRALVSVRGFVFVILGDFREDCPLDPQAVILPATLPVSVLSSERG